MRKPMFAIIITVLIAGVSFAAGGTGISLDCQFSNSSAVKTTAEEMGLTANNANELSSDIQRFSIISTTSSFLRFSGLLSGGLFYTKGKTEKVRYVDESGVGFGDARIAILPEVYTKLGSIDVAGGVAFGGGTIITTIDDHNGHNDGLMSFYGFVRNQLAGAFRITNSMALQVKLGYHAPFAGSELEFWFVKTDGDTVSNKLKPNEVGGFFIQGGLIFGKLAESLSFESR